MDMVSASTGIQEILLRDGQIMSADGQYVATSVTTQSRLVTLKPAPEENDGILYMIPQKITTGDKGGSFEFEGKQVMGLEMLLYNHPQIPKGEKRATRITAISFRHIDDSPREAGTLIAISSLRVIADPAATPTYIADAATEAPSLPVSGIFIRGNQILTNNGDVVTAIVNKSRINNTTNLVTALEGDSKLQIVPEEITHEKDVWTIHGRKVDTKSGKTSTASFAFILVGDQKIPVADLEIIPDPATVPAQAPELKAAAPAPQPELQPIVPSRLEFPDGSLQYGQLKNTRIDKKTGETEPLQDRFAYGILALETSPQVRYATAKINDAILEALTHEHHSGSTLSVAVVTAADQTLTVANIGNSPVMLMVRTPDGTFEGHDLFTEHHVRHGSEREAVEQRGGHILNDRVNGTSLLTRQFGNVGMPGLSHELDIRSHALAEYITEGSEAFLLVGTRGIKMKATRNAAYYADLLTAEGCATAEQVYASVTKHAIAGVNVDEMADTTLLLTPVSRNPKASYYLAATDGNGPHGHKVAEIVRDITQQRISAAKPDVRQDLLATWEQAALQHGKWHFFSLEADNTPVALLDAARLDGDEMRSVIRTLGQKKYELTARMSTLGNTRHYRDACFQLTSTDQVNFQEVLRDTAGAVLRDQNAGWLMDYSASEYYVRLDTLTEGAAEATRNALATLGLTFEERNDFIKGSCLYLNHYNDGLDQNNAFLDIQHPKPKQPDPLPEPEVAVAPEPAPRARSNWNPLNLFRRSKLPTNAR